MKNDKPTIICFTCSFAVPLRTDKNGRAYFRCPRCFIMALCRLDMASVAMRGMSEIQKATDTYVMGKIRIPAIGKWKCPTCSALIYTVAKTVKKRDNGKISYNYYCRDCGLSVFWNDVREELIEKT